MPNLLPAQERDWIWTWIDKALVIPPEPRRAKRTRSNYDDLLDSMLAWLGDGWLSLRR
jgi:hypothetical protein